MSGLLDVRMDVSSLRSHLNSLKKGIDGTTKVEMEAELARDFLQFTQKGLKEGKLGLTALERETIRRKRKEGYDPASSPLFRTGKYAESLTIRATKAGVRVGPIGTSARVYRKLTLKQLATIHAKGSAKRNIVPRNPVQAAALLYRGRKMRNTVKLLQGRWQVLVKRYWYNTV